MSDRKDDGTEHTIDPDAWLDRVPLILARDYTIPTTERRPRLIVIHCTEDQETAGSARAVARYFQAPSRPGSAHYVVDPVEVIECVRLEDIAWGAWGANRDGIHIEICGLAEQSRQDWEDADSTAAIARAAKLVAALCRRFGIPAIKLEAVDLLAGRSGICGHDTVSEAWPGHGDHWDPGPGFPWDRLMAEITAS